MALDNISLFSINENGTQYTIALDDLDLNLPINGLAATRLGNNVKPFWNLNRCNSKNYCEFELNAEIRDVGKGRLSDDRIESAIVLQNFELSKCHICDIDVPRIFFKEHITSDKHKMNTTIANNALERIKKHINEAHITDDNISKIESAHFCESCVLVVSDASKAIHVNSKIHLASIERDKLLKDLTNLYIQENNIDIKNRNEMNEVYNQAGAQLQGNKDNTNIDVNNKENNMAIENKADTISAFTFCDICKVNVHTHNISSHINGNKHKKKLKTNNIKDNNAIITKSIDVSIKKEEALNDGCGDEKLKNYIKHISNKINSLHSISYLNDKYIEIKTENGDSVKVHVENFHSFSNSFSNTETFCKLCWLIIIDDYLEVHKHTEMHIKNIMKPLIDGDCIRKIESSEVNGIEWSHCVLCNQRVVTKNVDTHISSQLHINNKKKGTISTNEKTVVNDKNIYKAENQSVPKENTQDIKNKKVIYNITSKEGNLKIKEVASLSPYFEMITKKIKANHSISPLNDKFIQIKTEDGTLIKVHIDNFHSYSSPVDDKDKSIKYCQLCNLYLGGHQIKSHKMSREHIENVMLPLNDMDCIRKLAGIWTHCLLCNERVAIINLRGHIKSETHDNRRKEAIVGNSDSNKATGDIKLESVIEEIELDSIYVNNEKKRIVIPASSTPESNEDELREYIELISKKIQADHLLLVLDKNLIEVRATNGDRVKVHIDDFHSYNCKQRNNAYCYLCSVHLIDDNIKNHKYIMGHITKLMATIKDRHCIRQFENSYHCMLCNVKIANKNTAIDDHIQDRDHCDILKEALITTPYISVWDEINEPTSTIYSCCSAENNKELSTTPSDVCDLNIQTHNMNLHLDSKKHKINKKTKTQVAEVENQTEIQAVASTSESNETVSIMTEREKDNKVIENKMDLEQYITLLNSKLTVENTLTALDDNTLEIEAKNGNCLKIHVDNYHGYQRCGLQKICMLCSDNLLQDDEEHKINLKHMKNITFPISDRHCIRQVMLNTEYIHCILCNKLVANATVNLHIRSEQHKGLLKKAFISKATASKVKKDDHTLIIKKNKLTYIGGALFCQLCNVQVAANAVILHLKDENHKTRITENDILDKLKNNYSLVDVKNISKTQFIGQNIVPHNNTKKSTIHYLMKYAADSNHLICKVCGKKLVNSTYDLNLHINDSAHKEVYMTLINTNKLSYTGDAYFCQLCNVIVAVNAVLLHFDDENHKTNITNDNILNKNQDNSLSVDPKNICKPVTDFVCNTDAEKKAIKKTTHYLMEYSTDFKQLICRVCGVELANTTYDLNLHIQDSAHQEKYMLMINKNMLKYNGRAYYCQLCNVIVAVRAVILHFDDDNHKSKINSGNLTEVNSNSNCYFCDVCNVNVPNNTRNVSEHLKGAAHEKRYDTVISKNKLIKSGDKYFCEVCKVDVAVTTVIFHVNDANHEYKLNYDYLMKSSSDSKIVTCKVCKVTVTNNANNLMEHLKGPSHEQVYNSMITKNKLIRKDNAYFCEICNVEIKESAELLHILDEDHRRKLDFCHICKVVVGVNNMLPHVAGKKHKEMEKLKIESEQSTSQSPASYYCDLCKVEFPKTPHNLEAHKNGYDHVNNLKIHTIKFLNDNYFCDICQTSFSESHIFEHVANIQHTAKLCAYHLCVSLTSYIANN